jgi:hypothetical protein
MTDVVEQGRERPGRRTPAWLRPVVAGLLALAAAFLLARSGLLSADAPTEGGPGPTGTASAGPLLVYRVEDRLVPLGRPDASDGARLPDELAPRARLVPVLTGDGTSVLVGVHDGLLFRVAPTPGERWQAIGRAGAVVAAGAAPGRVLVLRAGGVVELEAATGRVAAPDPYPGFDPAAGWRPEGTLSVVGSRSLLLSRQAPGGAGQELALAWPARRVEAGTNPPLQPLGTYPALLGLTDEWILTTAGSCPGSGCRVRIISVIRDAVLGRDVAPPRGWTFVVGRDSGRTREALVPVRRAGSSGPPSLARLVAGGDNALLVRGTAGVDLRAGLVSDLAGSVRLVTRTGGEARVKAWDVDQPARATRTARTDGLPDAAQLVCVCG